MFSMLGKLADGKQVSLVWRDDVFTGDPEAVDAVNDVIRIGEPVSATDEGPFFTPGSGDLATAAATAGAAFARVLAVESDEPWPEYDGGVVDHGPLMDDLAVQESTYDPHLHLRDRIGRWIEMLHPASRHPAGEGLQLRMMTNADEPGLPTESPEAKAMIESALDAMAKVHAPPPVQPAEQIPILVRKQEEEATYASQHMGDTGYIRPAYVRVNPDATKIAFVHEMGHYLDHVVFGRGQRATLPGEQFGSDRAANNMQGDHELAPMFRLLRETEELQRIEHSMGDDTLMTMHVDDAEPELRRPSDFFLYGAYLLEPWEVFARAYSQWVAVRSGDKEMLDTVEQNSMMINPYPSQWDEEGFDPIAVEFDRVFKERGLLASEHG